ncbi:ectoine/hydroxyectoine ABC transporter substrate-binding protein EhuB [Salinactinospora qingdaonensis]|uniref:Transporter substrate-binding domain-containing protein n=1 Tax=Salinactinospora qingdaonensis TaxID=702744 RepID=A0ABP7FZY7_9ACTN
MTSRGQWRRRDFFTVGGIALAAVGLAGCTRSGDPRSGGGGDGGQSTLQRLREQGYISAGFANEQPYGYTNDEGELTGESVELAKAIFPELGIDEVRGVQVQWDGLIPGLTAGQFDFVAAGMFITPDRCEEVAFSNPEYQATTAFMVPEGNPAQLSDFQSVADNSDVTLCVLNGAVEQGYAEELGVPADRIQPAQDQASAYELLETGRVDAIALTSISLRWLLKQRGGDFEVTEGFIPIVGDQRQSNAGAFAFQRGETELIDAVNDKLAEFKDNGRLLEILRPFGFTENELPGDLTAEQLCRA